MITVNAGRFRSFLFDAVGDLTDAYEKIGGIFTDAFHAEQFFFGCVEHVVERAEPVHEDMRERIYVLSRDRVKEKDFKQFVSGKRVGIVRQAIFHALSVIFVQFRRFLLVPHKFPPQNKRFFINIGV